MNTRDRRDVFAVAALAFALVASLVVAYAVKVTSNIGIAFVSSAGLCCLWIDLRMRRRSGKANPFRRVLPAWSLVPFVIVFVIGGLQHSHTRDDGFADVEILAAELRAGLAAEQRARVPVKSTSVKAATTGDVRSAIEPPTTGSPGQAPVGANAGSSLPAPPTSGSASPGLGAVVVNDVGSGVADSGASPSRPESSQGDEWEIPRKPMTDSQYQEQVCDGYAAPRHLYSAAVITHTIGRLGSDRGLSSTEGDSRADAERFSLLARTLANDLNRTRDVRCIRLVAERDTFAGFLLALAVQGLFVFWIPCLLAVTMARARSTVDQGDVTTKGVRRSKDTRDSIILGEEHALFIPRLCFAILLLLGTNYVFAPLGLKATYMMGLVDQHAAAGQTSFTVWTTSFGTSPVIVAGFLGFLLYALVTATQRFAQDDFDDQAMFSLLIRGLVVILLSFALSASPMPDIASRTFVFLAGVFPMRALEALGAKLSMALDPDFTSDKATGAFDGLPSLEPTKAFAMRTAGIRSTYDLAAMDINTVAARVRIDPRLLGRTVDRAILIDAVGLSIVANLGKVGIQVATELAAFDGVVPDNVAMQLVDKDVAIDMGRATANQISRRLATDVRVIAVREWLVNVATSNTPADVVEKVQSGRRLIELIRETDPEKARKEAESQIITVDLSAFGGSKAFELLARDFQRVGPLTDAVYCEIPDAARPQSYQYGRAWELRTSDGATIQHARMKAQTWGMPVSDDSLLSDQGVQGGSMLTAVPVKYAGLTDAVGTAAIVSPPGQSRVDGNMNPTVVAPTIVIAAASDSQVTTEGGSSTVVVVATAEVESRPRTGVSPGASEALIRPSSPIDPDKKS